MLNACNDDKKKVLEKKMATEPPDFSRIYPDNASNFNQVQIPTFFMISILPGEELVKKIPERTKSGELGNLEFMVDSEAHLGPSGAFTK